MTIQAWGGAAVLVGAALLVGQALNLLGVRSRAARPAVGFSVLIVIASIAIKFPGHAVTAAVILVVAAAVAAAVVFRGRSLSRPHTPSAATALAAAACAAIPFVANGRVGLLGVSLDNDTATHLRWAAALRQPAVAARYGLNSAYPFGPHSLVDALSTGLGIRLDLAFTGLMIATVVLTAVVGAAALRTEATWKQVAVGLSAALLYLVAAYYAEGAFKEQIMNLLLLGMVLHLEEVRQEWPMGALRRWLALVPIALVVAAAVYVYSYPALAWLGLTIVIWLALEVVGRPARLRRAPAQMLEFAGPAAAATGLVLILLAPVASRIVTFAQGVGVSPAGTGVVSATNLGNLAYALSPFEGLGIWSRPDFRFLPENLFHAGELGALALGVALFGLAWSLGRRQFLLPAAFAACAFIYWRSTRGQSPYLSAKALVIPAGVVAVLGLRGLLTSSLTALPRWLALTRLGVAAAFLAFAAHSSYQVLGDEPVWPPESTNELLSFGTLLRGQSVLFLGHSDFAPWIFEDANMSAISADTVSLARAGARVNKPYAYGTSFDFDTVDPSTINRFQWIITTNTRYASEPPAGVRLVRQLRLYDLWKRIGHVAPRQVIEPPGAPGAVLNCRMRSGRELSRRRAVAAVMEKPIIAPVSGILPGGAARLTLKLPAGAWDLSLQYTSGVNLAVRAGPNRWLMPAYLDRPGPTFAVGRVESSGAPTGILIRAERPASFIGPDLGASVSAVIATRYPETRTLVAIQQACGRYVDWFRASG